MSASSILNEIIEAKRNITISQYTSMAGLVVCLYDVILLLPDEIEYFWKRRRWVNIPGFFYLINRYVPPILLIYVNHHLSSFRGPLTDKTCRTWISLAGGFEVITLTCGSCLLLLRITALYANNRWLKAFLWTFCGLSYGTSVGLMGVAISEIQYEAVYSPVLQVCIFTQTGKSFKYVFVDTMPFEVTLGILVIWKAVENSKLLGGSRNHPSPTLITVLLRDGILWFLGNITLKMANASIWLFAPQSLLMLGVFLTWGLVSSLVSRFCLNLTKAGVNGSVHATASHGSRSAVRSSRPEHAVPLRVYRSGGIGNPSSLAERLR